MSNLDDIFDLPEGAKQEEQIKEKKPRKKVEMSDEKKTAMLERLKAGREKRAENLKAKAQPKEEVKEVKEVKKKDNVLESTSKKHKETEDEKLSFIKMMAGKSKPIEKVERPKKKVYALSKEEPKQEVKKEEQNKESPKEVVAPVVSANITIPTKTPIIIRTFKKPVWG